MAKRQTKRLEIQSKYVRTFSEAFKRQRVKDLSTGLLKVGEVCKMYKVSRTSVYKWIYLYSDIQKGFKMVMQMDSEETKTKMLLQRVAEMERIIGQKQMEIDTLNKGYELLEEELGYDVKKKYASMSWNGIENIPTSTDTK
jgi:transposase-like protein